MQFGEFLWQFGCREALDRQPLDDEILLRLLELARLCPSINGRQPLKYLLAWRPSQVDLIARHLRWGNAPAPGPDLIQSVDLDGYIVILADTEVLFRYDRDCRVAAQAILLAAVLGSLDGCVIRSIDRAGLRASLDLPDHLEILTIVGLGKPRETIVLENGSPDEPHDWSDVSDGYCTPTHPISELMVEVSGF